MQNLLRKLFGSFSPFRGDGVIDERIGVGMPVLILIMVVLLIFCSLIYIDLFGWIAQPGK